MRFAMTSTLATDTEPLPTPEQRQALCGLMYEAFVELRYLPEEQAHDLAYAFHNLPKTMYGWGQWSVEGARAALVHYQTKHQSNLGFDYVAAFDAIFKTQSS
jgi:hypothetical protein